MRKVTLIKIDAGATTPKAEQLELSRLKDNKVVPSNGLVIIATEPGNLEQWATLDTLIKKNPRRVIIVLSPQNLNFLANTNTGNTIARQSKEVIVASQPDDLNPAA